MLRTCLYEQRHLCPWKHSHEFNEAVANSRIRDGLPWPAYCLAHSFGRDLCRTAALAVSESEGMNRQIDWQAQRTSQRVYSWAEQICWEAWGTLWTWAVVWGIKTWRDLPQRMYLSEMYLRQRISARDSWVNLPCGTHRSTLDVNRYIWVQGDFPCRHWARPKRVFAGSLCSRQVVPQSG